MKTEKTKTPAGRYAIISKRRLEVASERWWEIFEGVYPLLLEQAVDDDLTPASVNELIKTSIEYAVEAADRALDAFEQRWPGV